MSENEKKKRENWKEKCRQGGREGLKGRRDGRKWNEIKEGGKKWIKEGREGMK